MLIAVGVVAAVIGALVGHTIGRRGRPPRRTSQTAGAVTDRAAKRGLSVEPRRRLPTFSDVGGFDELKRELEDTIGLLLRHPERAEEYRITWGGILLHGPPGCGKSFFARAVAGEFGSSLIAVNTADLISEVPGSGPQLVADAFDFAADRLPCVLLFDELDAIAGDRSRSTEVGGSREVLTQLLQCVEQWRSEPRLLVMATTNDIDALDSAVIRPGRFDRKIRLDLPDGAGRRAVLEATLNGRPRDAGIDFDGLARITQGCTPATLVNICETAALVAFRESIGRTAVVRITEQHLRDAILHRGGDDRPTVEHWNWDALVLPEKTKLELTSIQALLTDRDLADRLGVDPLNGVLLTGPPGTGKTTIAKVLAAESGCSFYPASSADLSHRWVGESEKAIARLFDRARRNAPAIIFLDEIDAIGSARGSWGAYDRQLDQLLQEIDGLGSQPGVMVLGATNRPQHLDPALVRGGRLSRIIELPLPDRPARAAILQRLTAGMVLDGVSIDELAGETDGYSGADLKSLCQQAALQSMMRDIEDHSVTAADIDDALRLGRATTTPHPGRRRRSPLQAD
ncbi:MAG: AAA family ATPase [Microthrixaceae bacterium]